MIHDARSLKNCLVWARDGDMGRARDLVLDESLSRIEYIQVHTGGWTVGREVLVATRNAGEAELEPRCHLSVEMTKLQMELSAEQVLRPRQLPCASRLRGFRVRAADHGVVQIRNVLFDLGTWKVTSLVVSECRWWCPWAVLIAPEAVSRVDLTEWRIDLSLSQAELKGCPPLGQRRTA